MKKAILILIVLAGGVWFASSKLGPQAPITDGAYLSYGYSRSKTRVTFKQINKNQFEAIISPGGNKTLVNKKMKTTGGTPYEVGSLGPLWIPPASVKVGGNAHGSRITEVKRWKKWDVGVVKASVGFGGALRGTWYYEKNTGFLVGGSKSTAVSGEGEGMHFALVGTNLKNL